MIIKNTLDSVQLYLLFKFPVIALILLNELSQYPARKYRVIVKFGSLVTL